MTATVSAVADTAPRTADVGSGRDHAAMPIEAPTPAEREALAARYRALLACARRHRAVDPCLSDGEQAVLRALLDPDDDTAALPPLAVALWGVDGAAEDEASGYPRTFAWLAEVRRG